MTKEEIKVKWPRFFTTLKNASKDGSNTEYMTNSMIEVMDFDKIPNEYSRGKGWPGVPKSNDALYIDSSSWTFIEFKNGSVDKVDIYRKIYDSIIMLVELEVVPDFDFVRRNFRYILVCKKDRFTSPSRTEIYGYGERRAKSETVLFELDKLKGYLLSEVHTYSPEEFETIFVQPTQAMIASTQQRNDT